MRHLREHLLPPSESHCNDENYDRNLVLRTFCCEQFWTPSCIGVTRSVELTLLRNWAKVADNGTKMFNGERYKLSKRPLQPLAKLDIHNMRGLDKAAEMLVVGIIKALAWEVGLALCHETIRGLHLVFTSLLLKTSKMMVRNTSHSYG